MSWLSAEDWSHRVAGFLSSTAGTDLVNPREESELGYQLIQSLADEAGLVRRAAKLDEARRSVDRIHALAKLIVARHPDQAAAHLCLSEAFSQRAKNAWKIEDRVAVERNWNSAIDEARQALRTDPRDTRASFLATELQRRLNDLLAPQRDSAAQGRSVQSAVKTGL